MNIFGMMNMEGSRFVSIHNKIHRRSGHIAVAYKGNVLVWGGYMEHVQVTPISPIVSQYHVTDEVWIYNSFTEVWDRLCTRGDTPPRNSGSCGVIMDNYLYIFGGHYEHNSMSYYTGYHGEEEPGAMDGNSNQLYRLNLNTHYWEWLHPSGKPPAPCDKLVGWLHQGRLYFFGGFGPPPTQDPVNYMHTLDATTQTSGWPRGWNNQLVRYNPTNNSWEWPKTRGPTPTPRAAHAADKIGDKVYIFGGRYLTTRTNDLHCLDLDTMTWSGNLTKPFECGPVGRSWHSFTFVSPTQAILYGGLNQFNSVLSDCWTLELPSLQWNQCLHIGGKPRVWHKAQYLPLTGELVIVGGHRNNILDPVGRKDHAEELVVLNFSPKTLLRLCLDAVLCYGEELRSEWCLLPKTLQDILRERMEQWEI